MSISSNEDGLPRPADVGSPGAPTTKMATELRRLRKDTAASPSEEWKLDGAEFRAWSESVVTARGETLDFDRFSCQRELYATVGDGSRREVVIMKGTQLGVSELLVRWVMYGASRDRPLTSVYVFPTERHLADFRNARVKPLVMRNPELHSRLGAIDNAGLMEVGGNMIYLRAAQSRNNVISIDADWVVFDEYDDLDPENVAEAERRIGASQVGLIRRVGVPSDPDHGIAKLYEDSDQRRWFVTCQACSKLQLLGFEEQVRWEEEAGRIVNPRIECSGCGAPLDVREGQWIARFPEREVAGFHVHRLMLPDVDLRSLIKESKRREPYRRKKFFRNDLGLPFVELSFGITRAAVSTAIEAGTTFNGGVPLQMPLAYGGPWPVTAGIDVASSRPFNLRISEHPEGFGGPRRALFIGTAQTIEEVLALLLRYRVVYACIDSMPERRTAQQLAATHPGVHLISYTTQQLPTRIVPEACAIFVNRTDLIDRMVEEFTLGQNLLPEDLPSDYVDHMAAVRRLVSRDELDRTTVNWISSGSDDYFHAEAFDVAATDVGKFYGLLWDLHQRYNETFIVPARDLIDNGFSAEEVFGDPTLPTMRADGFDPVNDRHGFYGDGA